MVTWAKSYGVKYVFLNFIFCANVRADHKMNFIHRHHDCLVFLSALNPC